MVQTKIFTMVLVEGNEGEKRYLSYCGTISLFEAISYCQEALVDEEKSKAVEEYKKGLENAN